jgi:hypothetical protein
MFNLEIKRAAVFGMDFDALKKQFGELFLAKRQSVASQETRGSSIHTKRAAVFGMDARIAIIVFSILGVVGAYYAEDVISKAQEDSVVEQVVTLRQAVKQNLADNDYDYTIDDTNLNSNPFGIKAVTSNLGRGRNNHSYINASNTGTSSTETVINTPARVIKVTTNNLYASVAATGASAGTIDCVNTSATCYYWFRLLEVDEKSFKLLDEYYDATTGGFADTASTNAGIIVAPTIDAGNDTATVLVKIGER